MNAAVAKTPRALFLGLMAAFLTFGFVTLDVANAQAINYTKYFAGASIRNQTHHSPRKTFRYSDNWIGNDIFTARITIAYGGQGSLEGFGYISSDFGKSVANAQVYCQWRYAKNPPGAGEAYEECQTGT